MIIDLVKEGKEEIKDTDLLQKLAEAPVWAGSNQQAVVVLSCMQMVDNAFFKT